MIKDTSNIVCGLGGNNLETLGSAQIDVTSVGLITVLIVKDLGYTFILGADELEREDANRDSYLVRHIISHAIMPKLSTSW